MSLASNYFIAQASLGVSHCPKQQHALFKFVAVGSFPDIHDDGINRIRALDSWIAKCWTQGSQRTQLGLRPKSGFSKSEAERLRRNADIKSGIKLH
jgi:hypothetical protein